MSRHDALQEMAAEMVTEMLAARDGAGHACVMVMHSCALPLTLSSAHLAGVHGAGDHKMHASMHTVNVDSTRSPLSLSLCFASGFIACFCKA